MEPETPSSFLFADLKRSFGISNRDTARMVLTDRPILSGVSPRDRAEERTFLSREIVHAEPGYLPESFFRPFDQAAQDITARCLARLKDADARTALQQHIAQDIAPAFCDALRAHGANAALYANALARIAVMDLANNQSRCVVYMLLYVASACLGDVSRAIEITEDFATKHLMGGFSTKAAELGDENATAPEDDDMRLGLVRVIDGKLKIDVHPLSCGEGGTVVGTFATGPCAIVDVEPDVSRSHLRIWRDADGRWLCCGMNSTYGTTVISGEDGSGHVVEKPRAERADEEASRPYEIFPGDVLCLGATTRFMVLEITE
ncbi:FHA domain-containing protein [Collinsella tanakaei]|uniref:FHA domain-containing protein n=1 Tax=Collinsella tanakaei TaxID=626935 RepID=UPI0025A39E1C|nr:FHA domain-containing protein [Collinsella tanakaei]MDM8246001.1 FHA domain-containing protein [Collinsella tanakaei]